MKTVQVTYSLDMKRMRGLTHAGVCRTQEGIFKIRREFQYERERSEQWNDVSEQQGGLLWAAGGLVPCLGGLQTRYFFQSYHPQSVKTKRGSSVSVSGYRMELYTG